MKSKPECFYISICFYHTLILWKIIFIAFSFFNFTVYLLLQNKLEGEEKKKNPQNSYLGKVPEVPKNHA